MDSRSDHLEARLAAAERQLRALRWALVLAAAAALGLSWGRPATSQGAVTTVKAPFHVTDAAGRKVLTVDTVSEQPLVRLYDPKGRVAAELQAHPDGASLSLRERSGAGVELGAGLGTTYVRLMREAEPPRAAALLSASGNHAALQFGSPAGAVLGTEGRAGFVRLRGEAYPKAVVLEGAAGGGILELYAPDGKRTSPR
jgi:hypothetical protein